MSDDIPTPAPGDVLKLAGKPGWAVESSDLNDGIYLALLTNGLDQRDVVLLRWDGTGWVTNSISPTQVMQAVGCDPSRAEDVIEVTLRGQSRQLPVSSLGWWTFVAADDREVPGGDLIVQPPR